MIFSGLIFFTGWSKNSTSADGNCRFSKKQLNIYQIAEIAT